MIGEWKAEQEGMMTKPNGQVKTKPSKKIPKEELYPNSTQFPNMLLDEVWPLLTAQEAMVLAVAVRKTLGWGKREETISLAQFCEGTGLGRHTAQKALHALKAVNLMIDLRWQPDGKLYTLNIWDELDYGPIDLEMLLSRRKKRLRAAQKQTKKARERQAAERERMLNSLKDVKQPRGKDVEQPRGKDVEQPTQNLTKPKKPKTPKGGGKRHPDHRRLMALYREAIREDEDVKRGKELSASGKENKGAQTILQMGFTPEEAMECYRYFKEEPSGFWKDQHLSLTTIAKNIGAWKKSQAGRSKGERYREVLKSL